MGSDVWPGGGGATAASYSSQNWINTQLARADAAIGTAAGGYIWSDLATSAEYTQTNGTLLNTVDGGVVQFGASSTNGTVRLANNPKVISNHRTSRWYYACRVKFVDAPDSGVTWLFGPSDASSNSITIALNGGTSTTNFYIQYFSGSIQGVNQALSVSIGSGISLGTWFDFALSFDGTTVVAWVNGVNVGQRTDTANIPLAGNAFLSFEDTPGAGLKKAQVDDIVVAWKSAS